ncbi:MAG: alpha/beta hydrolase-fold protein [Pirellulaceae bacterium]
MNSSQSSPPVLINHGCQNTHFAWMATARLLAALFIACGALGGPPLYSQEAVSDRNESCVLIKRRLPPEGLEVEAKDRTRWERQIVSLTRRLPSAKVDVRADIEVLLKACRYAIEHREFYKPKDFAKVDRLLSLASSRLDDARQPWKRLKGLQVRGFYSDVDDSPQPCGLVFPEKPLRAGEEVPLYVWLHGRGDKTTDLHFICERLDRAGQIRPEGAIVLHPFGRQCVGYKSAGETDVLEAIRFTCENYPVDQSRIVLMGFSMGGAGVWHLAAHHSDLFVAASPGAGFAETARYQRLQPKDFPPAYEQMLWKVYDVPGYVRNLFNIPVVAYSGEKDKQIQAARVMEEAYAAEGRKLRHVIGPGMGHKYHPDSLTEILEAMRDAEEQGQPKQETRFSLQASSARYARRRWLTIDGMQQLYSDTRVDGRLNDRVWDLTTKNVARLSIDGAKIRSAESIRVDGQELPLGLDVENLFERSAQGEWAAVEDFPVLRKRPKLSGPIDDAFLDPFLVVLPSGTSSNSKVDDWVECEAKYWQARWRSLFRGDWRVKLDSEVTSEDVSRFHLVLWGTPESNRLLNSLLEKGALLERGSVLQGGATPPELRLADSEFKPLAFGLPLEWSSSRLAIGQAGQKIEANAATEVPSFIYSNPLNPDRYLVVNSGPTFRTDHDRTNSLQNPHLPDWFITSVTEPRTGSLPGQIEAAGFFDDSWQLAPELTWPDK